jgi:GTPase
MAFIDEMKLNMKAGDGGNGIVAWLAMRGAPKMGPAGGDAGNGGDVFVRGIRDMGKLMAYQGITEMEAEIGGDGMKNSKHGKNGEDLILDVPIGSIVTNTDTGERFEIIKEGQKDLVLKGGRGGFGNEHFKGSRNTTPEEQTNGIPGEEAHIHIELHLIADFGLVGFPNAGKSSLLNTLTKAKSKIGSYQFTTLEPHLGVMHDYIIADIPGIIEGASENKGLGHKFLRHITRTKVLIHCVPADTEDYKSDYDVISKELEKYDSDLVKKDEIILITKTDTADSERIEEMKAYFESKSENVSFVSILDDSQIKGLTDFLTKFMREVDSRIDEE